MLYFTRKFKNSLFSASGNYTTWPKLHHFKPLHSHGLILTFCIFRIILKVWREGDGCWTQGWEHPCSEHTLTRIRGLGELPLGSGRHLPFVIQVKQHCREFGGWEAEPPDVGEILTFFNDISVENSIFLDTSPLFFTIRPIPPLIFSRPTDTSLNFSPGLGDLLPRPLVKVWWED